MGKQQRGFASMARAKQREIASKGGRAVHAKGLAPHWTSEQARLAGRKGAAAKQAKKAQGLLDWSACDRALPRTYGDST